MWSQHYVWYSWLQCTSASSLLWRNLGLFGIITMQTLNVFKKQLGTSCKFLTDTLMNIFRNYIPHKTKKFDYKIPEWINTLIIFVLKKWSILVKRYFRNPSEYNKETLLTQTNDCTKFIIETKQNYIAKMSSKLDYFDTASKTYWSIINIFLEKNIPNISPLLVNSYRIFIKKLNYLINTLRNNTL